MLARTTVAVKTLTVGRDCKKCSSRHVNTHRVAYIAAEEKRIPERAKSECMGVWRAKDVQCESGLCPVNTAPCRLQWLQSHVLFCILHYTVSSQTASPSGKPQKVTTQDLM